jgi:hypothetical protein
MSCEGVTGITCVTIGALGDRSRCPPPPENYVRYAAAALKGKRLCALAKVMYTFTPS